MIPPEKISRLGVTGIGSVPIDDIDRAVEHAFTLDVPYLPTLLSDADMTARVPTFRALDAFRRRLDLERPTFFKVQLTGPITWARAGVDDPDSILETAGRLIEIGPSGSTPILFFDEPALATAGEEELDTLAGLAAWTSERGAKTGVHCCGEVPWLTLLDLGLDLLSYDVAVGAPPEAFVSAFRDLGGRLVPGVVSTEGAEQPPASEVLEHAALLTPACGLGLRSVEMFEDVFRKLRAAGSRWTAPA